MATRATALYNVRRTDGEYSPTAMDGSNGCVDGSDLEWIQRWFDQIERGSARLIGQREELWPTLLRPEARGDTCKVISE
jgi:hypothetical protein